MGLVFIDQICSVVYMYFLAKVTVENCRLVHSLEY